MATNAAKPVQSLTRTDVESKASDILKRHGLSSVPIDPVILANKEGIKVLHAKFVDDQISGMIAKRGETISILVSESDPPYRKRFTIAHELGHHFLHLLADGDFVDNKVDLFRDPDSVAEELNDQKRMEIQANQFAAALLMPADLVAHEYSQSNDLSVLARRFNVSEEAMGYRLNKLGLV